MKRVDLGQASLDRCVKEAQRERVVLTRNGKPVALLIGVEGLDEEQLELGSSDRFWTLSETPAFFLSCFVPTVFGPSMPAA